MWANDAGSSSVFKKRVLALLGHRVRLLDDEDPVLALERPVRRRLDDPLAHLIDEVLRAGRAEPCEIGMRGRVLKRPPPRRVGVGRAEREKLRRERPGRGSRLPEPGGAGEEIRVRRRLERGGQRDPRRAVLLGGRVRSMRRHRGDLAHPRRRRLPWCPRRACAPRPARPRRRRRRCAPGGAPRSRRRRPRRRAGTRLPRTRSGRSRPPRPPRGAAGPARARRPGPRAGARSRRACTSRRRAPSGPRPPRARCRAPTP